MYLHKIGSKHLHENIQVTLIYIQIILPENKKLCEGSSSLMWTSMKDDRPNVSGIQWIIDLNFNILLRHEVKHFFLIISS